MKSRLFALRWLSLPLLFGAGYLVVAHRSAPDPPRHARPVGPARASSTSSERREPSVTLAANLPARASAGLPDAAAAERALLTVRALVEAGAFHDARDEALSLVARFPGTPWAAEVERHLLSLPLDQPSREAQQELERELAAP